MADFVPDAWVTPPACNRMGEVRTWCNEAGLPHCSAHGLRKAGAALAAENGATVHELMAIFGWLTMKEAERYTQGARRKNLARNAAKLLAHPVKETSPKYEPQPS